MSSLCHCSWEDVWRMTAVEWLNLVCYYNDKSAWEQAEMDKWKKAH